MIVKKGATDITTYVFLGDSSTGAPETGLTITNLDITYTRARAAHSKTDATALATVDAAHENNKAIEVDATQCPGLYRVDWPDDAFVTGVDKVILTVTCSGCHPAHQEVDLVDYDSQDSAALGLTKMPANVIEISGDSTAADNLEAACDGNTYNVGGGAVVAASVTGNVGGNVTGSVGSLGATAKSDVNAEVLDVLNVDTFAEPGQAAPGATVTLATKVGYLYKAWRNKSDQDATTYQLYNDDATTVDQKASVADALGVITKGEVESGP